MVRHTWRVNPGQTLKFVTPPIAPVASLLAWMVLTRYFGIELPPFLLFFPSVILVSLLIGIWPGVFTTVVSLFLAVVFLFPRFHDSAAAPMSERVAIAFFCAISVSLAVIINRYRRNQARVLALEREGALRGAALRTALESMTDAVFITDPFGTLVSFNHAFAMFHRYRLNQDCVRNIKTYRDDFEFCTLDGSLTPAEMRPVARALRGETATNCEYRLSRKDTGETWIGSFSFAPIREHGSKIVGSVVVARDITEQKRIEETLRTSEIRYRTAFQTSIDAIAINRLADGTYIEVNQTFLEGVGCQREDIIGKTSLEIGVWVNFEDRVRLAETLRQGLPCRSFQTRFRRKNGEIFSGVVSASVIELEGEPCILSVIRDLSEAKQAEAEIRNLAFFDPLTGLSNRRFLLEQVRESVTLSVRSHRQRALLFIDLDHFKNLNDSLGYQTGDMVLREVAKRLNGAVRDSDTVSRLAGDEFVVLIEDLSDTAEAAATQALNIAKSILARVDRPYVVDGHESAITCSIGITVFGDRLDDVNEILQQADIAMYQAKSAGRNTVRFFAPALQAAVNARGALEEGLRLGLRAKEFELYYQPQFESGRICGVESLLRWNHPTLGLLSPGTFIPLAEETRLIIPLGNWILDAACRQLKAWEDRPDADQLHVAVNISAMQLREENFVETILDALNRTGANPRMLRLELTESMLVTNVEDVITKMSALKAHGLSFSLDDFGTGYSSLSYLRRLPVDQLKIDRSFVSDILVDPASVAIAQTIISLSRAMGLPVIAEGVETAEQLAYLESLGCHCHQGFYFSKPLTAGEFERLLPEFLQNFPPADPHADGYFASSL